MSRMWKRNMNYIQATDEDIQNQRFHIDVEALINSTANTSNKEYLEEMYLRALGLTKEVGEVIWEDNKIIGFKPYKSCEYVSVKIIIDN